MVYWNEQVSTILWLLYKPISQKDRATKLCIDTCIERNWRLSIQTHKYEHRIVCDFVGVAPVVESSSILGRNGNEKAVVVFEVVVKTQPRV